MKLILPEQPVLVKTSSKPLYQQLDELIRNKLHSGEWSAHDLLPSENELARNYRLSRMTVRSVIVRLAQEGLLYRVPGKGTYVAEKKITTSSLSYIGIREQLEKQGFQTSTEILDIQNDYVSPKLASKFHVGAGTRFCRVERLRLLNGLPLSLHYSFVPASVCPGLDQKDLVGQQLCDILCTDYNLSRHHVIETLESTAASAYEAEILGVRKRFHLLLLKNFISSEYGIPFEYAKIVFRGDKIKLKFEY
ncbi:MAG: GntR family transcriptional regulator [Planctomycetaceae bacterium]|nr:GntR family transcriptional regulator [Planctomycetaceae bacterium]